MALRQSLLNQSVKDTTKNVSSCSISSFHCFIFLALCLQTRSKSMSKKPLPDQTIGPNRAVGQHMDMEPESFLTHSIILLLSMSKQSGTTLTSARPLFGKASYQSVCISASWHIRFQSNGPEMLMLCVSVHRNTRVDFSRKKFLASCLSLPRVAQCYSLCSG